MTVSKTFLKSSNKSLLTLIHLYT